MRVRFPPGAPDSMVTKNNFPKITIPEDELEFDFSRASGKGGQNLNKRSTRVQLYWSIGNSKIFSEQEKRIIRNAFKNRVTQNDEIIFAVQKEKSQDQNRDTARELLNNAIQKALKPKIKRIATKPTRGSVEKRIKNKKELGEKKELRKVKIVNGWL